MVTITLPPVVEDAATGRQLAAGLPDDVSAAHVEVDASAVALADHGFVPELMAGLLERGLEVLVVDGAAADLRSTFADAAEKHSFGEIWFATGTATSGGPLGEAV
ncbi:hypothetical protein [Frondihabitans cladoniiphilus]|uniref:STAS domain-containing protein n=1 Tax=Frondihabitans cladoniiphilus TaxID=715785 RepID=A0ABP8VPE8_9MICO